jgi:serine/threonine protein kinase
MASENTYTTSDFELLSETGQGTWLVTKKNDYRGVKYIAQPLGILDRSDVEDAKKQETVDTVLAFYNLMYNLNQGPAIAQILNHENIISIAGHIKTHPVVGAVSAAENPELTQPKDYIVWDFCDAANLSALFQSKPYVSSAFYLPESLCWHVLTSLLNAITYLHDGKRLFLDTKASPGEERKWMSVDQDWNPILHRAIEPRNIFFQHPRGIETYGLCKLGNFEHAVVTNHVITPGDIADAVEEDTEISRAMAPYRGLEALDMTRHQLLKSVEAYTAVCTR